MSEEEGFHFDLGDGWRVVWIEEDLMLQRLTHGTWAVQAHGHQPQTISDWLVDNDMDDAADTFARAINQLMAKRLGLVLDFSPVTDPEPDAVFIERTPGARLDS